MKRKPHNDTKKQQEGINGFQDEEDAIRSTTRPGILQQHYDFKTRRKTQEIRQNDHVPDEFPSQLPRCKDHEGNAQQVGAFAVGGNEGTQLVEVASLSSSNDHPNNDDDSKGSPIIAHLVDEESPSLVQPSIFEATPLTESEPTEAQHLKALLKSRKCRILSALTLVLIVAAIVAAVLLTQNGNGSSEMSQPAQEMQAKIKPLLTTESWMALEDPKSAQSQSLRWLVNSNFQDFIFERQVQRYAMATIYYATIGQTWSNGGGNWLTDDSECTWVQSSDIDICDTNGTLQTLDLSNNTLTGTIPDEIGLLRSLKVIDLSSNLVSGTWPSEIGSLIALTSLSLYDNTFTGTVPSELGSLTTLKSLNLDNNVFDGTLPSEIGSLIALTSLSLYDNKFTGTVASELGSLTALKLLNLDTNIFNGTLPAEMVSLAALTSLLLHDNEFTGTVTSELGTLSALKSLNLDTNKLSGTVPSELGSLTALTELSLGSNSFNGTVASELDSLTALR